MQYHLSKLKMGRWASSAAIHRRLPGRRHLMRKQKGCGAIFESHQEHPATKIVELLHNLGGLPEADLSATVPNRPNQVTSSSRVAIVLRCHRRLGFLLALHPFHIPCRFESALKLRGECPLLP